MFVCRFLSCIWTVWKPSWQPKSAFHGLLRFLRFFRFCTYNYITMFRQFPDGPWLLLLSSCLRTGLQSGDYFYVVATLCYIGIFSLSRAGTTLVGYCSIKTAQNVAIAKKGWKGRRGGGRPMPIIFEFLSKVIMSLEICACIPKCLTPRQMLVSCIPSHVLGSELVRIQEYAIPQYRSYYTLGRGAC